MTSQEFSNAIIAQDDDQGYDESGYVAIYFNGVAHLGRYGHCSCYGTFDALCGGGVSDHYESGEPVWDWSGSIYDLYMMAINKNDPAMPSRVADPKDSDYDHLMNVYGQIIRWFEDSGT